MARPGPDGRHPAESTETGARSLDAHQVGQWQVTALDGGRLSLDGGAMWGVVPRVLWERWTPPDALGRMPMAMRPFLAECGDWKVVIEAGLGERYPPKWREMYALEDSGALVRSLAALGVEPGDITHAVGSHAHWDHIGAWVDLQGQPLFPQAQHTLPEIEIQACLDPGALRKASYRKQDIEPLIAADKLVGLPQSAELLPGISMHILGGHSDGVSVITIGEGQAGATAVFWSDVVPTRHHIQPPFIMAYDIDARRSFEVRSEWLERAAREDWISLYFHDLEHPMGRLSLVDGRYVHGPV